jgi:hypothetical protein
MHFILEGKKIEFSTYREMFEKLTENMRKINDNIFAGADLYVEQINDILHFHDRKFAQGFFGIRLEVIRVEGIIKFLETNLPPKKSPHLFTGATYVDTNKNVYGGVKKGSHNYHYILISSHGIVMAEQVFKIATPDDSHVLIETPKNLWMKELCNDMKKI